MASSSVVVPIDRAHLLSVPSAEGHEFQFTFRVPNDTGIDIDLMDKVLLALAHHIITQGFDAIEASVRFVPERRKTIEVAVLDNE